MHSIAGGESKKAQLDDDSDENDDDEFVAENDSKLLNEKIVEYESQVNKFQSRVKSLENQLKEKEKQIDAYKRTFGNYVFHLSSPSFLFLNEVNLLSNLRLNIVKKGLA